MSKGFVGDESGMTMALAVVTMVLVGVMGAGLLAFVQEDLGVLVETNRGERALQVAEAGVAAAEAHLASDAVRQHYDKDASNDCAPAAPANRPTNEDWSPSASAYSDARTCPGVASTRTQVGVEKAFDGGRARVTIECFRQADDPALGVLGAQPCSGIGQLPPEPLARAKDKAFFKVTSVGREDASGGDGAVRKIEAIVTVSRKYGFPRAYYTPNNISFDGGPTLSGVSFFAGRGISGITSGSIKIDRDSPPSNYGDWFSSPYNTTPRKRPDGAAAVGVGFGAVGKICGGTSLACVASAADGYYDYDSTTALKGQNKTFVYKTDPLSGKPAPTRALSSGEISFPFDPGDPSDPRSVVDPNLLADLRARAESQGNLVVSPFSSYNIGSWPAAPASGEATVYWLEPSAAAGKVFADFQYKSLPRAKGVLVVKEGNLDFSSASSGFEGVIIVLGDGATTGFYKSAGSTILKGYVVSSGNQTIKGSASADAGVDYSELLGASQSVRTWASREIYR